MDMGGNVGTQSSTVFVRGLALGHIKIKNFRKHFTKEVLVGVSIGVLAGAIGGAVVWTWQAIAGNADAFFLALSVTLALVCAMSLASILGFLIPWLLIKLNVDQAAGAAPIITGIKDMAGLLIYFGLVSLFLGHLIN
jgi:magnesium transporter